MFITADEMSLGTYYKRREPTMKDVRLPAIVIHLLSTSWLLFLTFFISIPSSSYTQPYPLSFDTTTVHSQVSATIVESTS